MSRTIADVRGLREEAAKPAQTWPAPPGRLSVAYGEVLSVDNAATPPIHKVMLLQGPSGGRSGRTLLCVAVAGATIAVGATVRLLDVPGAGVVAERIAPQEVDTETIPQHQHSSEADGGLAAFLG